MPECLSVLDKGSLNGLLLLLPLTDECPIRGLHEGRQLHGGRNIQLRSGHSSCRAAYSISLSTAALRLSAGGFTFTRTPGS